MKTNIELFYTDQHIFVSENLCAIVLLVYISRQYAKNMYDCLQQHIKMKND